MLPLAVRLCFVATRRKLATTRTSQQRHFGLLFPRHRSSGTNKPRFCDFTDPPLSSNHNYFFPTTGVGLTRTNHLITTAGARAGDASVRLSAALNSRFHLTDVIRSYIKSIFRSGGVPRLKDIFQKRVLQSTNLNRFKWPFGASSATLMSLTFFNGDESNGDSKDLKNSQSIQKYLEETYSKIFKSENRQWTNILIATNVFVHIVGSASGGKVFLWGAQINELISKGQLWRLVTSSFLHGNTVHLMFNCFALHSLGPNVEEICGPRRYLTIYMTSAIASAVMSYWLCKGASVGASGAIFGLVGSFAVYLLRNRDTVKDAERQLQDIAELIGLNLMIGLVFPRIDNWGHIGGLLGGAAVTWFLVPNAWENWRDERRVLTDKAPYVSIFERYTKK